MHPLGRRLVPQGHFGQGPFVIARRQRDLAKFLPRMWLGMFRLPLPSLRISELPPPPSRLPEY